LEEDFCRVGAPNDAQLALLNTGSEILGRCLFENSRVIVGEYSKIVCVASQLLSLCKSTTAVKNWRNEFVTAEFCSLHVLDDGS